MQKYFRENSGLWAASSSCPWLSELVLSQIILVLAYFSGGFLRIWQINAMGFNTDEAVYAGQAASIAGVPILKDIFPVFRAHPLLFQFLLSIFYKVYFSDLLGRLLVVAISLITILVTYQIGKILYGPMAGAIAAFILALMPYHVIVSRQVLLDVPLVFFTTLTLYFLARFGSSQYALWLFASGVSLGLAVLSKETGIIMLGAVYAFLALSPEIHLRFRDLVIATICFGLVIAPFPVTLMVAGGSSTGKNYLVWQLFRRPNHDWLFYPQTVPPAIGYLVILLALAGIVVLWKERSWRERLLLAWVIIPIMFFQLWPVKGFQYLLAIAPPFAILAGRLLGRLTSKSYEFGVLLPRRLIRFTPTIAWILTVIVFFSVGWVSWQRIQPNISSRFLAGTGGVPGGREAGAWILENVPDSARFTTIGPSMANIIQFYGRRKAYGLAVSPNPLHRNPSYEPVMNLDQQIRQSSMQYLVWDTFSASRSTFFTEKLLSYVNKYNGRVVHTESITVKDENGNELKQPVIIIYEVHP